MGGGENYPSATTVQSLVEAARAAEARGDYKTSAESYREASEILLTMGKSKALTDDERYCFELQSKEFLQRAILIEDGRSPSAVGSGTAPSNQFVQNHEAEVPKTTNYQNDHHVETQSEGEMAHTSEQAGACVVGATAGLFAGSIIGLPVFGSISGGIFGGVAATRDDEYGERARRIGRYGANVVDKSYDLNKRYNIVGNIKVGAESVFYKAQEFDKKHNVVGRVVDASSQAWKKVVEFRDRHRAERNTYGAVGATADGSAHLNEQYRISERVNNAVQGSSKSANGGRNQGFN